MLASSAASRANCPAIIAATVILHLPWNHVKIVHMNEEVGLRERKKRERRRCIEDAAIGLFEEHGFDGTTIEQIAAAADIAPRTFFYYFPTKEDVVLADYASRLERIVSELGERPESEPPWEALRASFLAVAADYEAARDDLVRRFTIMADNATVYARSLQLQAGWEDALAEVLHQRADQKTENLESRLLAASALACMRSSLRHWILTGHTTALPALVHTCFGQLADGLTDGDSR